MRWIWMLMLLCLSTGAAANDMWRWVDERGIVHYSDRPHPGAERVDLGPAQSYTAPALPPPRPVEDAEPREPVAAYSRLSIVAPGEEEVLWNIGGELNVQIALEPRLANGHQLRLYLDGNPVAGVPQGPSQFTIGEVYRGEHTLRASIVNASGRELASSDTVTFFVQQTSILSPSPQVAPPPAGGG